MYHDPITDSFREFLVNQYQTLKSRQPKPGTEQTLSALIASYEITALKLVKSLMSPQISNFPSMAGSVQLPIADPTLIFPFARSSLGPQVFNSHLQQLDTIRQAIEQNSTSIPLLSTQEPN